MCRRYCRRTHTRVYRRYCRRTRLLHLIYVWLDGALEIILCNRRMRRKSIEEHPGTPRVCVKVVKSRANAMKVENYGGVRVLVCVDQHGCCCAKEETRRDGGLGDYGTQNSRQRQTKDSKAFYKCMRVDVNKTHKYMHSHTCVCVLHVTHSQKKGAGS